MEFINGDRYTVKSIKENYQSPIKVGTVIEVVRPFKWADRYPHICCGFSCPCCDARIVSPEGKVGRKYYQIVEDLYELEKEERFVSREDIISALLHQRDRRYKSLKSELKEIKVITRTDTRYGTDFGRGGITIERLYVKRNGYGTKLLIGEHSTPLGPITYNIQSISLDDWRNIVKLLK